MTGAEMDIIIGANVDQAIAALKKLGFTITKTEQAASNLAKKGKKDFTEFSRVIQDLPFGFAAISNNLTQLIPGIGSLGLAFSAVVAAITFAQVGFSAWTRGFAKNKEEADEFAKSLKSAESGALTTGVKLQAFVDIARDNTKSLKERNLALDEANKLMGEHGEKLTLVNINTKAANDEIIKFTKALIAEAVAAKFADKIADLIIKQKDASIAYGKALQAYNTDLEAANRTQKQFSNNLNATGASLGNIFTLNKARVGLGDVNKKANEYKDTTKELRETTAIFNQTIAESVALFGKLGTKIPETARKFGADKFQWLIPDFNFQVIPHINEQIKSLVDKPFPLKLQLLVVGDPLKDFKDKLDKLNGVIQQAVVNLATSAGEAIGNIFSGKGSPFDAVFQALGAGIKALGQQLIEISAIAQIVQKALATLITNPALALVAGIALVALGTAIANIKQPKKFATGGVVTSPTLALVGEQGPERITPLGYEGRANNMWGNGQVEFVISGNVLRGMLRRADQTAFNTF